MAMQNWIAMRTDLHIDPAVIKLGQMMEPRLRTEVIVGYLWKVWCWADQTTEDGVITGVTLDAAEEVLHLPGFLKCMTHVGWLEYIEDTNGCAIIFPNWETWMCNSTKRRLKEAQRKQLERSDKKRTNVRKKADKTRTRCSSSSSSSSLKETKKRSSSPPTVDEVRAYCQERGNSVDPEYFVDYYQSQNWKKANGQPLKDWKAGVRTFEKREQGFGQQSQEQQAIAEKARLVAAERSRMEAEQFRRESGRRASRSGTDESRAFNDAINRIEREL